MKNQRIFSPFIIFIKLKKKFNLDMNIYFHQIFVLKNKKDKHISTKIKIVK